MDATTSLVKRNHIELMCRFITGGGTEFLPRKDPIGNRKPFVGHLVHANELEVRLRQLVRWMIEDGRFLLYLQPNGRSYRIHSYAKHHYKAERNSDGEIERVTIIYSYKFKIPGARVPVDRWIKLVITDAEIWQVESDHKPTFEDDQDIQIPDVAPIPNVFGFVPCVEVLNPASAGRGESDFTGLEDQLEAHDTMAAAILDNLEYFSRSPFVTTRDAEEVEEHLFTDESKNNRNSVAYASGFRRKKDGTLRTRKQLKRVIGGVEEGELFEQLRINPLPGDLLVYANEYEGKLRAALGGIAEGNIETATETRILYGGVEVTAREKRESLYTYGICKILEMALTAEEAIWLESSRTARTPEEAIGLQPAFDEFAKSVTREVGYRTAPVFVPTTKDVQDRSIVGRNLQRLGVDVKETLRQVYPDKNDDELAQMVGAGGLPVEYLNDVMATMQTLLSLMDPLTGGPIVDPETGLPLAYTMIPLITKSLNYGNQFKQPWTFTDPRTDADERAALAAAATRVALERAFAGTQLNDPGASRIARQSVGLSQPLPAPDSNVTADPNQPGWWQRNFPTFSAVGSAATSAIAGLFGSGGG